MPRPEDVRPMFDRIAGRYDLMNRVMTLGVDQRWRRAAVEAANVSGGSRVLDACCGTGDIAMAIARSGVRRVTGLDFSTRMLDRARDRVARAERIVRASVTFVEGDALNLPFEDDLFDAVTVGFGVRNVEDVSRAFAEFRRVVRPGGRIVCLEITRPPHQPARSFYNVWFDRVVPVVGRIVTGDSEAYSYLPESTRAFPPVDELADIMRTNGLADVAWRTFGGGIVALHSGTVEVVPSPATGTEQALAAVVT